MYSYEERIRAVKLYIKLGGRLGATIRKLGYPTKNSLISWYREYEREQDLQVGYSRTSGKYSAEQKQLAVQHFLDHDQCIASTLRAMGYPSSVSNVMDSSQSTSKSKKLSSSCSSSSESGLNGLLMGGGHCRGFFKSHCIHHQTRSSKLQAVTEAQVFAGWISQLLIMSLTRASPLGTKVNKSPLAHRNASRHTSMSSPMETSRPLNSYKSNG